ncbi:MAG: hypothetical protein IPK16_12120 [Anaerolineales bacterium]|nr:hypothetical protein [Anaerolineales bacterium]
MKPIARWRELHKVLPATRQFSNSSPIVHCGAIPAGSFQLLNQTLPNGWTFLGYFADERALADGATGEVWTFWQAPTLETKPEIDLEKWTPVSPGVWGRVDDLRTLIAGGNFEQNIVNGRPGAFPNDVYRAQAATRQLRRIDRDGATNTVASLTNDAINRNTSFATDRIGVQPDMAYLLSAEVYNLQGNPRIGWRWNGIFPDRFTSPEGTATPLAAKDGWQQFAGLAAPLPGASSFQAWLVNSGTDGAAYFDDVTLLPLPAPAPLWPGIPTAAVERAQQHEDLLAQIVNYPATIDDPAWLARASTLGPSNRAEQILTSGWTFLGYHTDEQALVAGARPPLLLYFRGPEGAIPGAREDGWIDLGSGRWLFVQQQAQNVVQNGDFEGGLDTWSTDFFEAPEETHALTVSVRSGYTTTAGVLANTEIYSNSSFISPPEVVAPDSIYLQAGWLYGPTGRSYIGRQWSGRVLDETQTAATYLAGAQAPSSWQHFAGIAEPPPGAENFTVWLLNYLGMGPALFDNMLMVALPAPAPLVGAATLEDANFGAAVELFKEYQADPALLNDEVWLSNLALTGPARQAGSATDGGWTLLGYTTDESVLAGGLAAPAFFFWQGPVGVVPGDRAQGWHSLDADLWVQIVDATTSVLPNGNLEIPVEEAAAGGFPLDYATSVPAADRIAFELRDTGVTSVVTLANDNASETDGVASAVLPVAPEQSYVLAAWAACAGWR